MSFGLVELLFSGAVALGLGFWQLWSVNRDIRRDRERKAQRRDEES